MSTAAMVAIATATILVWLAIALATIPARSTGRVDNR